MIHKSYPILGSCSTETQNPNALRLMRVICQLRMSVPYNFVKENSKGKKRIRRRLKTPKLVKNLLKIFNVTIQNKIFRNLKNFGLILRCTRWLDPKFQFEIYIIKCIAFISKTSFSSQLYSPQYQFPIFKAQIKWTNSADWTRIEPSLERR